LIIILTGEDNDWTDWFANHIDSPTMGAITKLLIGWLAISGVFPASVQAEIWNRAAASGMNDVAVAPDGLIWLTGKHGAVWLSDNMYGSSFAQIRAEGCNRIAVGPDSTVGVSVRTAIYGHLQMAIGVQQQPKQWKMLPSRQTARCGSLPEMAQSG
jgi:hypothetical protein